MIELLILYVLSEREMTMYSVLKTVHDIFGSFSKPSFGAIKPALTRLEKSGHLRSRKAMSDGGKLSGFYSITQDGREYLKNLILEKISENPLQFFSNASIKLCCSSYLPKEERKELFASLKKCALEHKYNAVNTIESCKKLDFYQKIAVDNSVMQYKNFATLVENFEKDLEKQ